MASHAMVRRGGQPDEAGTRRALNSMLPIRSAMCCGAETLRLRIRKRQSRLSAWQEMLRCAGRSHGSSSSQKLTIIIPAYNEESTIAAVLAKVHAVSLPLAREVIVVNDGSTDSERKSIVSATSTRSRCARHGAELRQGRRDRARCAPPPATSWSSRMRTLEVDPAEHTKLLEPILNEGAPVVYGSRFWDDPKACR